MKVLISNTDELWDALRMVACTLKLDAKRIVKLEKKQVERALKMLEDKQSELSPSDSGLR